MQLVLRLQKFSQCPVSIFCNLVSVLEIILEKFYVIRMDQICTFIYRKQLVLYSNLNTQIDATQSDELQKYENNLSEVFQYVNSVIIWGELYHHGKLYHTHIQTGSSKLLSPELRHTSLSHTQITIEWQLLSLTACATHTKHCLVHPTTGCHCLASLTTWPQYQANLS